MKYGGQDFPCCSPRNSTPSQKSCYRANICSLSKTSPVMVARPSSWTDPVRLCATSDDESLALRYMMENSVFSACKHYPCDPDCMIPQWAQPITSKAENVETYSTNLSQTSTEWNGDMYLALSVQSLLCVFLYVNWYSFKKCTICTMCTCMFVHSGLMTLFTLAKPCFLSLDKSHWNKCVQVYMSSSGIYSTMIRA